MMLSMMISGPKQPGNDIGVYLNPLVEVFDVVPFETFMMHAMLFCIYVMHVEKNVCDSLIGTLLNIQGKTKDGVNARLDLVKMKIQEDLAPREVGRHTYLPPACYTMFRQEKISFCLCLKSVKVPQGYSSNIHILVSMQDLRLVGLLA